MRSSCKNGLMTRSPDHNFSSRVTYVTGGANGIGRAAVTLAASRGDAVAVMDRDGDACASVTEELRSAGATAIAVTIDVSDEAAVQRGFEAAREQIGPPNALVTSAGIDAGGRAHEMDVATWDTVVAVNLRGTFLACRQALQTMHQTGGAIVCVSSPFALLAAPGITAYGSSKAGVSALVRSLALDYAAEGVRVNAVLPGSTETQLMWASVPPADIPRMREIINQEVPMGRMASPEEIARTIVWLLSDDASYVTGAQIACDGGLLAKAAVSV
jgi:NAD(P)-dependent dehydrogenase (short-subunit alcohol dehydrogenase family)